MFSFHIDYKNTPKSDLCELGRKYDTDKSVFRYNGSNSRHCHPYTLFYKSLFGQNREAALNIAEIGILEGSSLRMWKEYFPNASICGFDVDNNFLLSFRNSEEGKSIPVSFMDVKCATSITTGLSAASSWPGGMFDIIIEDTTHQIDDQIRVIQHAHSFLKPGGILIVEDIFKDAPESQYAIQLADILSQFEQSYFVTLDHRLRNSVGWNNDKLLILVKAGVPLFHNSSKLTIITPCCRPDNLQWIKDSINFSHVNEWIIVYDGTRIAENPHQFKGEFNGRIKEYIVSDTNSIVGNSQRNFALSKVSDPTTYLYYLDDDNIVHPDLFRLVPLLGNYPLYTFNQMNRLSGDCIQPDRIDTAMFLLKFEHVQHKRWIVDKYEADGLYITDCHNQDPDNWVFVNNTLCTYNACQIKDKR